jgi:co-chaperonin GroES (HSP10)
LSENTFEEVFMKAGLEKLLVRRKVGEQVSKGGIVMPEAKVNIKSGDVVWGEVLSMGPRSKAGSSFGHGEVAYDVRVAKVIEKEDGFVIEAIEESDILAFRQEVVPRVEKDRNEDLEEVTEGPKVEDE